MLNVENSTEYEKVAPQVYQAILDTDEVQTIEVLHNVQIKGRSGVAHQIDVYGVWGAMEQKVHLSSVSWPLASIRKRTPF